MNDMQSTHLKSLGYLYDFWTLNDQSTVVNGESQRP